MSGGSVDAPQPFLKESTLAWSSEGSCSRPLNLESEFAGASDSCSKPLRDKRAFSISPIGYVLLATAYLSLSQRKQNRIVSVIFIFNLNP